MTDDDALPRAEFVRLLDVVQRESTHRESVIHGEAHWRAVAWTALELAPRVPGSDRLVAFLFGLLHDSQRLNDGGDPEHGPRAARFTRSLAERGWLALEAKRLDRLVTAISNHTTARPTPDPTLGLCYDADRLNLWRLGIEPLPQYLSTGAAKDPATIACHERLPGQHVSWGKLYGLLRQETPWDDQ